VFTATTDVFRCFFCLISPLSTFLLSMTFLFFNLTHSETPMTFTLAGSELNPGRGER
jgi:hypothetical protein